MTGCSEDGEPELGRSDIVRWYVWPGEPELDDELVEGAEEILGLELLRWHNSQGAVTVYFDQTESTDQTLHGAGSGASCSQHVFLRTATPYVLAHEIGHTLGLGHVDDRDNLMYSTYAGDGHLTEQQLDQARENAWLVEYSCIDEEE